jgi:hypothetical protein
MFGRSWNRLKPVAWYLTLYCLAVAGALSFERPFGSNVFTLLIPATFLLFLLCAVLYLLNLGVIVRALELFSGFAFTFIGNVADRPANQDVAFFVFVFFMLGMCILTPPLENEETSRKALDSQ